MNMVEILKRIKELLNELDVDELKRELQDLKMKVDETHRLVRLIYKELKEFTEGDD